MATRARKVDPQDARRVKHSRIGVWDLYEERQTNSNLFRIPGSSIVDTYGQMIQNASYVVRMLKDVLSVKRVQMLLPIFLVTEVSNSLIPAVSLWYSGQLLRLVPIAIERHTMDSTVFIHAAVGHFACNVASRLLLRARYLAVLHMDRSMKQFYARHIFHSTVRLDLPTMEDPAIQKQLHVVPINVGWRRSVACETIEVSTGIVMSFISMLSQLLVLFTILREQQDSLLLVILGFSQSIIFWFTKPTMMSSSSVWVATTTNRDYMRMQGLEKLVSDVFYRKELVAGNLKEYITAQFYQSFQRVGDDAGDFDETREFHSAKKLLGVVSILHELIYELPQIIMALYVVQKPMTILLSFALFILIEHTSHSFMSTREFSLAKQFSDVRELYEIENVENNVVDGIESFPENQQTLRNSGVSVEFRNVSFQYPGAERCALRNVSFKIGAGQLCVIVGTNGSGKSTILKLVSRIYDPTEGTILIDNRDIKTLRLADLRAAMSVLFQDYTHFPLSIHENIGLGNPALAHDDDKIREAARLGGAEDFIDELPDGFNSYVIRPVRDSYPTIPVTPSGQSIDFSLVRSVRGIRAPENLSLSGGQMQRLAVSRTFMRSLATETESSVGMLLFDEPSASLDPTAEHDLFERLRKLRGNKTLIFSTHRFGNLTRYADLILYIDESVKEQGTHDELLRKEGEYARIWNLQAKPYL